MFFILIPNCSIYDECFQILSDRSLSKMEVSFVSWDKVIIDVKIHIQNNKDLECIFRQIQQNTK